MRGGDLLEVWREAFGVSPQRRTALRPLPRRDRCVNSTLTRLSGASVWYRYGPRGGRRKELANAWMFDWVIASTAACPADQLHVNGDGCTSGLYARGTAVVSL
jgi:hypothetical protein